MSGRREFDSIEEALEAFDLPSDDLAVVREHLATHADEQRCSIPSSGQYIGLTPAGGRLIDDVNRGFIHFREDGGPLQVRYLPTNSVRDGG